MVASAWNSRTAQPRAAHGGRPSCLLLGERQGTVLQQTGIGEHASYRPHLGASDAESRGCIDVKLGTNSDSCTVSSGFEGGRVRRVTPDTLGANRPCSNALIAAQRFPSPLLSAAPRGWNYTKSNFNIVIRPLLGRSRPWKVCLDPLLWYLRATE